MKKNTHLLKPLIEAALIVLFTFSIQSASAQQKIVGVVKDVVSNTPIFGAVVSALNSSDSTTVTAFATTNSKGVFAVAANEKVRLKISHISYERFYFSSDEIASDTMRIFLFPADNVLQEVNITVRRPVVVAGDTTKYRLENFRTGEERSLEDVLKKIPNLSIEQDGSIYFKNKKIEKILLDGNDLTGQNYEIATRSLTSDIISEVEAIENYMENRVMRTVKKGNQTVLNLKLDELNKKKLLGNIDVGLGSNAQLITGSAVSTLGKWKSLTNVTTNNIGIRKFNKNSDLTPLHNNQLWAEQVNLPLRDNPFSYFPRNLNSEQENINNEKVISSNHVVSFDKKTKLTSNVLLANDVLRMATTGAYQLLNDNPFSFTQTDTVRNNFGKARGSMKLESDLNETSTLTAQTYADYNDNRLHNALFFDTPQLSSQIAQPMSVNNLRIFSQIEYTKLFKGRNVLNASLRQGHSTVNDRSSFNISSLDNSVSTIQVLNQAHGLLSGNLSWTKIGKGVEFQNDVYFSRKQFDYTLSRNADATVFNNSNTFTNSTAGLSSNIKWEVGKFQGNHSGLLENVRSMESDSTFQLLDFKTTIAYKLNNKNTLSLSFIYDQLPQFNNLLIDGPLINNFRSVQTGGNQLVINKQRSYVLNYIYVDVLKTKMDAIFSIIYSQQPAWSSFNNFTIQNELQQISIYETNNNTSIGFDIKANKLIYALRGTVKLNASYLINSVENNVNETIRTTDFRDLKFRYKYITSIKSILFSELSGEINRTNVTVNEDLGSTSQDFFFFKNRATLGTNFIKNSSQISLDYFSANKLRVFIFDLQSSYKINPKSSVTLIGKNMLNVQKYLFTNFTTVQEITNTYNLLGRRLLLSYSYSF